MKEISKADLVDGLFNAAIPCIEKFIEEHNNETFFGFAIETLAEEGYFHLCASSSESFQSTVDEYLLSGETLEFIMGEDIKWNNQEWAYFDLNYNCNIWNKAWEPMLDIINSHKNNISQLNNQESTRAQQKFSNLFKEAGEEVYMKIINSRILDKMKQSSDFRSFFFEHHDAF
ncbi:DUF4303 domain-containing protein [Microbulbifer sp. OS29]|uniref:DUF4303 domain-containing protein n=1 Tax=Microbulbifer okhotskensis TaxID=2926617 RepID=A0A9X2EQB2_9GAMM|nr:DUF4303 domain-containing protein [Microbulbifer okhotskensis]MCO1336442.1 DUF4303 domain-containing protein [Microbulbifer okhotskensis]